VQCDISDACANIFMFGMPDPETTGTAEAAPVIEYPLEGEPHARFFHGEDATFDVNDLEGGAYSLVFRHYAIMCTDSNQSPRPPGRMPG
jgi:hypothetical protein